MFSPLNNGLGGGGLLQGLTVSKNTYEDGDELSFTQPAP